MLYREDYPHGGDRYSRPLRLDFSANTHPLGTHPAVREALRAAAEELDHYPDPYCRELVATIATMEGLSEEMILCGSGAADLIDLYVRAVRPRVAMMAAPTFGEYGRSLSTIGCEVRPILLRRESCFQWDHSALDALREVRPDLLVLCSPNNPTGRLIPPDLLDEMLSLVDELGVRVLLDECFIDLADRYETRKGDLTRYPGLMILNAFTKSHGLAGVRLGYGMTDDRELLARMSRLTQPWNVSLPAQRAGTEATRHPDFVQRAREIVQEERPAVAAALEEMGLEVCPSDVGFLLFHGPRGLDRQLLEQEEIAIRNCATFPGLAEGWYRIAIRTHEENAILLHALGEVMMSHE